MTIDEAIRDNEEHAKAHRYDPYPDYFNALNLGNEALKFTLAVRGTILNYATLPLPGETEK